MPLPGFSGYLALFLQQRLQTDPTIAYLLGGGGLDPRVYHYYDAPAEVTPEKPSYISWAELSKPKEVGGVTQPVFSLRVYSYQIDRVHEVEQRIEALFDKVVHSIATTTSPARTARTVTSVVQGQDIYDQSNRFCGREVHVMFGALTTAVV